MGIKNFKKLKIKKKNQSLQIESWGNVNTRETSIGSGPDMSNACYIFPHSSRYGFWGKKGLGSGRFEPQILMGFGRGNKPISSDKTGLMKRTSKCLVELQA